MHIHTRTHTTQVDVTQNHLSEIKGLLDNFHGIFVIFDGSLEITHVQFQKFDGCRSNIVRGVDVFIPRDFVYPDKMCRHQRRNWDLKDKGIDVVWSNVECDQLCYKTTMSGQMLAIENEERPKWLVSPMEKEAS
jgi:hypothetical protein